MKTKILIQTIFCLLFVYTLTAQKPPVDLDIPLKDQVILDDLIVNGSECVGLDCSNGESFGFDTQRYKENNLRVRFFDTSSSASFPTNDWEITINDSSNGGSNYFGIKDIDANRSVFRIEAGARSHALVVEADGDIGVGTLNPVADIHIVTGNTPTVRLHQDGSSGFTQQTWDLAGNEANFFIRDATNGSTLPFRIRPGAPSSVIDIQGSGNVGINDSSADAKVEISLDGSTASSAFMISSDDNNDGDILSVSGTGSVGINTTPPTANTLVDVGGNFQSIVSGQGAAIKANRTDGNIVAVIAGSVGSALGFNDTGEFSVLATTRPILEGTAFSGTKVATFKGGGNVGIGQASPAHKLDVNGSIGYNGSLVNTSDKRLKKDIQSFEYGLNEVMQLNPITFKYNGTAGRSSKDSHVGLIAQELQSVAPSLVSSFEQIEFADGNIDDPQVKSKENYLQIQESAIKYMLVNAMQEQQTQIEELNAANDVKDAQINALQTQVDQLNNQIQSIHSLLENFGIQDVSLNGENATFLGQNIPNPYKQMTSIAYQLPDNASQAELRFYDLNGQLLKVMQLSERSGVVRVSAQDLVPGTYTYSLVLDNQVIESKKMIYNK